MLSTARNKQILPRFFEDVWNDGNLDAVDDYLAPLYAIHHDPGDPWDGKTLDLAEFKERLKQSRAPFPDQRFKIEDLIGEADRVAATWTWTGTHDGDLPGFPASGKAILLSGITVYHFDDGRMSGHWQDTDRFGVFPQLSL